MLTQVSIPAGQCRGGRPRPPAGRGRRTGLTLIEVMVAVTLLGLLSVGIITALRIAAGSWIGTRDRLTQDRRIASANQIFHSAFSGMVPMTAQSIPGGQARFPVTLFFQGEPETMRFVSAYSITAGSRSGLNVFELQVVNSGNGRRVLLNQFPYGGPYRVGELIEGIENMPDGRGRRLLFRPVEPRGSSLIVADELTDCEFRYLRPPRRPDEPAEWIESWTDPLALPLAVSVGLIPAAEPGRLLPVSITTPIPAWQPSPFKFMARGPQ